MLKSLPAAVPKPFEIERKILHARINSSRQVGDWTSVVGATAEIVKDGKTLARGIIDGVTNDGAIVWLQENTGRRRLYERCESFEVWVTSDHLGLNYRISAAETVQRTCPSVSAGTLVS